MTSVFNFYKACRFKSYTIYNFTCKITDTSFSVPNALAVLHHNHCLLQGHKDLQPNACGS